MSISRSIRRAWDYVRIPAHIRGTLRELCEGRLPSFVATDCHLPFASQPASITCLTYVHQGQLRSVILELLGEGCLFGRTRKTFKEARSVTTAETDVIDALGLEAEFEAVLEKIAVTRRRMPGLIDSDDLVLCVWRGGKLFMWKRDCYGEEENPIDAFLSALDARKEEVLGNTGL